MTSMARFPHSRAFLLAGVLVAASALAACGRAEGGSGSTGPVVLGTSLPLTGSLQSFGTSLRTGYQRAVDEINGSGGLGTGGEKRKVSLVVRDNASDPNKAAEQVKSLVLEEDAVALLGPATPPLTIPVSVAAEQLKVPLVSTITPVQAWKGAAQGGWNYSWDIFFDENQMTRTQFQTADLVETNKKVVIFTDQEEDGIVMGGLWEKVAPTAGYEIAYRAQFPVGNTNFGNQVAAARKTGADIVIAQVIPPDGISLLREMKAQNWDPKLVFIEKGGNTGGYPELSEGLAEGTMAANWFAEGMGLPQESEFIKAYTEKAGGVNSDLGTVVYGYSAASVLLDAIAAAGSTDPAKVNGSIGETDADYPAGHVKFDGQHAAVLPAVQTQWQGSDMRMVLTADGKAAGKIVVPMPGLR